MANYATLKAAIEAVITQNGNNDITGDILQSVLLSMVSSLGANYQFVDEATPDTNPGTPDQNVYYVAGTEGTYPNFNGLKVFRNEVAIFSYNGAWKKTSTRANTNSTYINNVIVGKGQTYSAIDLYGFVPGHKYRMTLKSVTWDLTGVTISSGNTLLQISSWYGETFNNLFTVRTNATPNPYYDFVVPANSDFLRVGGRAADGVYIYFAIEDITLFERLGAAETLADAEVYRKVTSSHVVENDENGTRLRILLPVKTGMKMALYCNDPGGSVCGVWNSKANAVFCSSPGRLQLINNVYLPGYFEADITADGWFCASMTNGTTPITDARQQEMLQSIWLALGTGESFVAEKAYIKTIVNGNEIDNIESKQPYSHPYFGEKISINNSFNLITYATNSLAGQSAARYGDYLFIVQDRMAGMGCYNIRTKTLLYTLDTGIVGPSNWHCNQSSFSPHFYDAADMFPVLFVSQQNDENGRCIAQGYRIIPVVSEETNEIESFTISLVQTINFPVMNDTNCLGNANATFDLQCNWLWCYSRNNNSEAANYRVARFTKFNIPDLRDQNDAIISVVNLTDSDIVESFSDNWSMLNAQGGFIRNGKLVIGQGYPSARDTCCRVIDLYVQKKMVSYVDIISTGFQFEPEGMFEYDGKIMMHTSSTRIFVLAVM